ncbi:MAG: shikimate dehydrogenase [Candidatus Omnitrophota bacterium]
MSSTVNSKLYGLIGFPVRHSLSASMHNAAFNYMGINASYRLFEIEPDQLKVFLLKPSKKVCDTSGECFAAQDILGFNVTIPYKIKVKEILEDLNPEEAVIGEEPAAEANSDQTQWDKMVSSAVNTVCRKEGGFSLYNTDAQGFLMSLEREMGFSHTGKDIMLLGCGGAGRAVVAALTYFEKPARRVYIFENNALALKPAQDHFRKFKFLSSIVRFISKEEIGQKIRQCHLLVNATPVGMNKGDPSPIDNEFLHKDISVYDVVYNRNTELVSQAVKRCQSACTGLGMLLYQGVLAWQLWIDKAAPVEVMRQALNKSIGGMKN